MIKSARLVLSLGLLLGGSVAVLPNYSFAATRVTSSVDNVEATVTGYLGLSAINHEANTGVTTYTEATNTYAGVFSLMGSTNNFGTTTYEVTCNFISDPNTNPSEHLSGNCSNGWGVTAESVSSFGGYAAMVPSDPSVNYQIKSTSATTNPLSGTTANWLMKINGVSKTVSGQTFSSSAATGYNTFHAIPATNNSETVAEGNTFRTISNQTTYIGTETFEAQYGFTAGMDAVAGSYTGQVTYTLYIKAS